MPTLSPSNGLDENDRIDLDDSDFDAESRLDVTCPACDSRLNGDALFDRYRICPNCARHFWIPARERIDLLVDAGSFRESNAELASVDPLQFRDASPRTDRTVVAADASAFPFRDALITGAARIGGQDVIVAVVDFALLGEDIGVVAGEKLVLAIEQAASRRAPFISAVSGSGGRNGTSILSLVQSARLANAVARLQRKGVPFVGLLSHPASGTVYSGFACHANLLMAEPGSQIGTSLHSSRAPQPGTAGEMVGAEEALAAGMIDGLVDRRELRDRMVTLIDILTSRAAPRIAAAVEAPPVSALSASQEASLAAHPDRPRSTDYITRLVPGFVELHGDRAGMESPDVHIGLGQLDGVSVGIIAVDRPHDDQQGDIVAGLRKATRLLRLASLLELPVLTLYDSLVAGEANGEDDPGAALALLFRTVTTVPVPTVSVILGEATGSQAMWGAMADRTLMMEHAVIGLESPENALHGRMRAATTARYLSARECRRLGLVEVIVPEPGNGAHADPQGAAQQLRLATSHAFGELAGIGPRRLQDERSRKLRMLAIANPASTEEVRLEIARVHDLQRSVGRSIDDIRDRIEMHAAGLPSLPPLPSRPGMPTVPGGVLPHLPSIKRPSIRRPEIGELAERLASTKREFAVKVSDVRSNLADSLPGHQPDPDDSPSD